MSTYLFVPNNRAPKQMKQTLMEISREKDNSTMIEASISHFKKDRITRQKINRKTEDLKNLINQLNLTDVYRTLHSTTKYIFSQEHMERSPEGTFARL